MAVITGDGSAVPAAHAADPRYPDWPCVQAKVPEALGGYFALIEEKLSDGRAWVHGGDYTVSDGYLIVFTRWLEKNFAEVAAQFPKTLAHRRRVEERPAVQRALAQES